MIMSRRTDVGIPGDSRRVKKPGQDALHHAKPVFAVGGTVSGYGSLGSAESLTDKSQPSESKDKINMDPESGQSFKSSFAKELHQENIQKNSPSWRQPAYRSSFIDEVINEDSFDRPSGVNEDEYVRVKRENEILKRRLSQYNTEDEKYKKLEFEIEQLTWQLGKVSVLSLIVLSRLSMRELLTIRCQLRSNLVTQSLTFLFPDGTIKRGLRNCHKSAWLLPGTRLQPPDPERPGYSAAAGSSLSSQ